MVRKVAEGAQGTSWWKRAPVNPLACFPASLPGSRVDRQVRRDCGPEEDGKEGKLVPGPLWGRGCYFGHTVPIPVPHPQQPFSQKLTPHRGLLPILLPVCHLSLISPAAATPAPPFSLISIFTHISPDSWALSPDVLKAPQCSMSKIEIIVFP